MHEVAVVSDFVKAILVELGNYKVESVASVTLVIGKLTNLGAEQMEFAYEVVTRETLLEGSELVIEEEDIVIGCRQCEYEGPAQMLDLGRSYGDHAVPVLSCPECGGPVTVLAGQSCSVKGIDIEEAV